MMALRSMFIARALPRGAVLLALAVVCRETALAQAPAATAAKPTTAGETIVLEEFKVSSVRGSLINAQEIKQNSLQFVDSIVAQDIGKFPDNSVADALQRIPGIQVGRSSGEVDTVVVRGLPNLGTTLNGQEIFTGTGRGVALQDIPAELLASVDVFKSSAPEQLEGGIAGLIDIRLRRPLDFKGFEFAGTTRGVWGENANKMGWIGSVLLSDRWKTDQGELGALYSYSYQRRHFVDQTVFNFLFEPVDVPAGLVAGQTKLQLPFTQGSLIIPGDRKRTAHDLSLQWRPNQETEVYVDFLNTAYRDKRAVHFLIGFPRFGAYNSATVIPGTNVPTTISTTNNFHLTSTQSFRDKTDGYQVVGGVKWKHDAVKFNTDAVYNWNSVKHRAVIVDTQFVPPGAANFRFDLNNGDGQANLTITGQDITAASNYALWGLFDNHDYSTSEQKAWKADVEYAMSGGFLSSLKAGIRYSDRDARFRATSANDIAPAAGRGVTRTSTIPGFGSVNPDGPISGYGTPHWYGADPDWLFANVGTVRTLFGQPTTDPNFNPTLAFTDTEKTYAAYGQAKYHTGSEIPVDGLFGVRVVKTEQSLAGYRTNGTSITGSESQTDILPVLNGRAKLQDNLMLRFSAGRAITRPNFNDLNPAVTLNAPTTTGGAAGTGSGGNPNLKSVKSDNYDVSLEHYFARGSYVALTGFYRKIDGYVQSFAAGETINGVNYNVVRPRNAGTGKLQGVEATYQHFPEFLPSFLKGFGWHLNFTYITGDTDDEDTSVGAAVGARTRHPYPQVSKYAYNVIGIYERGGFSARLAYNYRGRYTDTFNGPNAAGSPLRQIIAKPRDFLDFQASYRINDHFTVTLDLRNITDSRYQDYFFNSALYPRDTRAMDRTAEVGVRFRY